MNHKKRNQIVPQNLITAKSAKEGPEECECDSVGYNNLRFLRPPTLKRKCSNVNKALHESLRDQGSSRGRCDSGRAYSILESTREGDVSGKIHEREHSEDSNNERSPLERLQSFPSQSNILLQYFASMTTSKEVTSSLDLDFLREVIKNGVSVNNTDSFGQTVLHEAVRSWQLEVARLLIDQGADVNIPDNFGRTPLHVAAATDHQDMVKCLVDRGANVEANTISENQTPLHYAARNEAVQCVKTLLAYDAEIDARDYKQRTPLLVAAEYNSAEVAAMLLENGAFAGVKDDSGLSALVSLILKMPSVAIRALDQFHITDRTHRKQQSYLNFLENCDLTSKAETVTPSPKRTRSLSPLQAVVETNCFELVMHPIFQRLIDVKWQYFGRNGAWADIILNFLLTVIFTALAVTLPDDAKYYYTPLRDNWWRIPLELALITLFLNEVRKEVLEYYRSRRKITKWANWRTSEVSRDFKFCHPRWPQEKLYLEKEITIAKERKSAYFKDLWNGMDWVAYAMLIVVFSLHFIRIYCNSCNQAEIEIVSCTLIVVWIRLLKYARPFPAQGPFVVILDRLMTDVFRWLFIAMMFYIPYAAAFWIMFGGRSKTVPPVEGYEDVPMLIFTMIRFPLVDDYNFKELRKRNPLMAQILCGSFLILGAIVLMNMFIALMSDTFQRVFDNAKATAAMQRARLIQEVESDAPKKKIAKYKEFIKSKCSPEERDYLVVITNEEDQTRRQTEKISELHHIVSQRLSGKKFGKIEKCDFEVALEDIDHLKGSNTELSQTLKLLAGRIEEIATSIHERIERFEASQSQTISELRISQERKFEETQLLLVKCNEESRLLQLRNKDDLKVFEAGNFEELHLSQAECVEEMRVFQEENFQELKHLQAMNTEEFKLLEAQNVEEFKQFHARECQVRKGSRKQIVQKPNITEAETFEKFKLETAKKFEEIKLTRTQMFQELKVTTSQQFKELRSVNAFKGNMKCQEESHSEVEKENTLLPEVKNYADTVDERKKDTESSLNVSTSDKENKLGRRGREIENLRSELVRGIEHLRQMQVEAITNMRRMQDKKIRELKKFPCSDKAELEGNSLSRVGATEGSTPDNIRQEQEEHLLTLRKIYGTSASKDKRHYSATKTMYSPESSEIEE